MSNRRQVTVNAFGIGVATGAYGISFGAIAIASGLSPWQTQLLSLGMFTGASQFALVGVLGAGGGAVAAVLTAFLIGTRNGLYSMHVAQSLQ
ncbi:MAG: AzlC family ABC transporter permease, partial [Actinomycetales bacterium]